MEEKSVERHFFVALLIVTLTGALALSFSIKPVKGATATVYIRADGSIDPVTAPISSVDKVTYTFVGDLLEWRIIIERDNIVLDGCHHTLQGTGDGSGISLSGRSNIVIKSVNIKNFYFGISLSGSSNISISGNNITANNGYGIWLYHSNHNIIDGNNIANNGWGIVLNQGEGNVISGNNITSNSGDGILFWDSSSNEIFKNIITANGVNGIQFHWTGNPYASTDYNIIIGNNILCNEQGIWLNFSNYNVISQNNITANNWHGIILYQSNHNTVCSNYIAAHNKSGVWRGYLNARSKGLWLLSSNENTIYHNNFINNREQTGVSPSYSNTWDNGFPSGGNYWSNYKEAYPDAMEFDDSKIWNRPYVIDGYNSDRYPLMAPFYTFSAGIWNGVAYNIDIISNSTVSEFFFDPNEGPFIRFDVAGPEGTIGFCRVTIPNNLLWVDDGWKIFVGGEPVNYTIIPYENYTYLVFTYNHSIKTVEIQGTHAIPEFHSALIMLFFMLVTLIVAILLEKGKMQVFRS
jgi:parallel beta-helix repeat protein